LLNNVEVVLRVGPRVYALEVDHELPAKLFPRLDKGLEKLREQWPYIANQGYMKLVRHYRFVVVVARIVVA
jgi:hypothetical protein